MQKILDLMIAHVGVPVEVIVDPERVKKADIDDIFGSNDRLRKISGWSPRIPLEESVAQMMNDDGTLR